MAIYNTKAKKPDATEQKAYALIAKRTNFKFPPDAFLRVETVSDFSDAVFLLLSGVNVGCEPVAGVISGFAHPVKPTIVRRVSDGLAPHITRKQHEQIIRVADHPFTIAQSFANILTLPWTNKVTIDLTGIKDFDIADQLHTAFDGFVSTLNYRSMRLLSVCDIAALLNWIAPLASTSRMDIQVPYGSASWGPFVRRESDVYGDGPTPPAGASRTIVAYVLPEADDLDAMLLRGGPIGLVNGASCAQRIQGFRGTSPDKAVLLPNFGFAVPGSVRLDWIANPEDLWKVVWLTARQLFQALDKAMPATLQDEWAKQHETRRLIALSPEGDFGQAEIPNVRNHALRGCIKKANDLYQWQPYLATCKRGLKGRGVAALQSQLPWLALDHNAALTVEYGPSDVPAIVDWLRANWSLFRGATFQPVAE